jgi:uncharacterized protein (DUF697 family)
MDELLRNALILFTLFCIIPSVLLAVVAFLAFQRFTRYVNPDLTNIENEFARMQKRLPNASREALLNRIIAQQSRRAGIIGAVTSLGGFFTLPITLPVDVLLSLQVQNRMVEFIAASYGKTQANDYEARIRTYLVMTGGIRATETTSRLMMRFLTRILGKSFAKLIPFVGAIIGFAVNYAIARATGELALRWYSGKLPVGPNLPAGEAPRQLNA